MGPQAAFTKVRVRRHHCRHCGLIVCSACSPQKLCLAKLNMTKPERVCTRCVRALNGSPMRTPPMSRPASQGSPGAAMTAQDVQREIVALYRQHNPSKVSAVPGLMIKYAGREEEMLRMIRQKYGVVVDQPIEL